MTKPRRKPASSRRSRGSSRRLAKSRRLEGFLPWVADWFLREVGVPTAPQEQAWPEIQAGNHTLVHSPTGSGKTFAAFLWALNELFSSEASRGPKGVRVLYISPLKALDNDIERNLRAPLAGIRAEALSLGIELPEVQSAVRTGDTTPSARAAMVRRPPDILITTPESLYLILTSPRAREILRTVETVIVDEIHTVCANKRGVHLSLSLERLEQIAPGFQRIGLSATQRPLEEVARFLGGQEVEGSGREPNVTPRPVSIVDAEYDKELQIRVIGMPATDLSGATASVWPNVIPKVLRDVLTHDTTLIFSNNRRGAERAADRLNAQLAIEKAADSGEPPPTDELGFTRGIFATGAGDGPFRAHHGSISEEQRREMERDLKAGLLPALIGTSSLELGIDIGSVDMVVQLQSPKSVTQGLQRVGRAGHAVGDTSVGKIYATHHEDLLESAVVAKGMIERAIEEVHTPQNALDVLSQQVVAAVSVHDWKTEELYCLLRGSFAYRDLPYRSFESVLKLVAGRYPSSVFRSLRARVYWDEVNGLLSALPGARLQALTNGGAIVDSGQFAVYLPDRKTRVGELDEEFVFETSPGDAFMLGSQVWRAVEIDDDRVIVEPSPGAMPRMPFWRGDLPWRPFELSERIAGFRAEIAQRLEPYIDDDDDPPELISWLRDEYLVDEQGARQLIGYVRGQLRSTGVVSSTDTIIVETYTDPIGDRRMVVQSPFGGRVNAPWAVGLAAALRERVGVEPEMQIGDNGILFRFPEAEAPLPVDIVSGLTADQVRESVLANLADSALFGAVFRRNAHRALLLPAPGRGRRTPFWLQRLRAKDLLAVAKGFPDFPILLESYRDCLEDEMDLPSLERVIDAVQQGDIRVVHVESRTPSPVARGLSFGFTSFYMYEWDAPKAERSLLTLHLDRGALAALFQDPSFAGTLRPEAISEVVGEVSRTIPGRQARSAVEIAQMLLEVGDLSIDEAQAMSDGDAELWLSELESEGRARRLEVETASGIELRWVAAPDYDAYRMALDDGPEGHPEVIRELLRPFLGRNGPVTAAEISTRYGLPREFLESVLSALADGDEAVSGYFTSDANEIEWIDEGVLARIHARTLSILRSEIEPASPLRYAAEVARLHGTVLDRDGRPPGRGAEAVRRALEQLRGVALAAEDWTRAVLPSRVSDFSPVLLEPLFKDGDWTWAVAPSETESPRVRVFPRATGRLYLSDSELARLVVEVSVEGAVTERVWDFLRSEGVASSADLRSALAGESLLDIRNALRELVLQGLVTADSWSALGALLAQHPSPAPLAASSRPGRQAAGASRRDAARRIREVTRALPPGTRWSPVSRYALLGPEVTESERAAARVDALLGRHGVVTRRAVEAEGSDWAWGPLASEMNLMEMRGAVRRGYFVSRLPGLQFGAPGIVEKLRAPADPAAVSLLQARDPANALLRPDVEDTTDESARLLRFSRVPSTFVAMTGEGPLLLAEDNGARVWAGRETGVSHALGAAVTALRDRRTAGSDGGRIAVEQWNGKPVLETEGAAILEVAGFRRDYPGMVYDALQARAGLRP